MQRMDQPTEPDSAQPHDILAAEMFALPGPDPILHHSTLTLPEDLTGSAEPVDVLAAEEFAMPAPTEAHPHPHWATRRDTPWPLSAVAWVLLAALALLALYRHRVRKRA
jgi:hypothetical protein